MAKGWIKIWRTIADVEELKDDHYDKTHAFGYMIARANIEDTYIFGSSRKRIKRGQFHTSIRKLSVKFGWSERKLRLFLDALEKAKMIKTRRDNQGITIEIVNYDRYQNRPKKRRTNDSTDDCTNDRTQTIENSTIKANQGRTDGRTDGCTNERQYKKYKKGSADRTRFGDAPAVSEEGPPMGEPLFGRKI